MTTLLRMKNIDALVTSLFIMVLLLQNGISEIAILNAMTSITATGEALSKS